MRSDTLRKAARQAADEIISRSFSRTLYAMRQRASLQTEAEAAFGSMHEQKTGVRKYKGRECVKTRVSLINPPPCSAIVKSI
ncbi:hypothetical protein BJF95_16735 [Rhizobium oryziradicis]|uniref:Uncharacterized protein n=1 Tax=Rhizobium oryziradicis TaxID=1867956 RepID=A0A1Q8ZX11_9HYPH|nr:hypothetical protein BJF95_16735 [Rhizobium oryziradicis]